MPFKERLIEFLKYASQFPEGIEVRELTGRYAWHKGVSYKTIDTYLSILIANGMVEIFRREDKYYVKPTDKGKETVKEYAEGRL